MIPVDLAKQVETCFAFSVSAAKETFLAVELVFCG